MTPQEVLEGARELIETPQQWMGGGLTNGKGRYCAIGAISKFATGECGYYTAPEAERILSSVMGFDEEDMIPSFNDSSSHDCVLAAFDAAIEVASATP